MLFYLGVCILLAALFQVCDGRIDLRFIRSIMFLVNMFLVLVSRSSFVFFSVTE